MSVRNPSPSERQRGINVTRIAIILTAIVILGLLAILIFRGFYGDTEGEEMLVPDQELPGEQWERPDDLNSGMDLLLPAEAA